jgi:protein ImuB
MRREPGGPRILAVHVPDLPLQRVRRGSVAAEAPREGAPAEAARFLTRALEGRAGVARSGAPLAVIGDGRVACCDAAARAAGVRPGQTAAEALAACGALATVSLAPAADLAALRALAEAALALAPAVEVSAPDVLLLDASAAHLLAGRGAAPESGERRLAERVRSVAAEMGYATRAAIATGRGPARALAVHARAPVIWVPPGRAAAALGDLPVSALGLSADVVARLAGLGITRAGALAALPVPTLAHRFGTAGVAAARLARGEDDTPLVPYAPETLPEEALELDGPAESAEPLLFALKRLADRVAARLAGRGLGATRLKLVLRLDPRGEEHMHVPLAQPTASAARWLVPAREHLFALKLGAPVTGLRLLAVEVAPIGAEQLAIGDRPEAFAALEGVLTRLAVRLGDGAVFAAEPADRHRPEAAWRAAPFRPRARTAAGGCAEEPTAPPRRAASRKTRGAALADAAETALRLEPAFQDPDPGRFRPTRLLAAPTPIVAEGEGGRLTSLRIGEREHAVLALDGPERLRGEWWTGGFERDYFRARLAGLGDCWVYRDGADGRLYLHGFFD